MKSVDYLIIGQGLAGSMIGWELYKQNQSFLIIDNYLKENASTIGAGLINYISGKRLTFSWQSHDLIPFALDTYRDLEKQFNSNFITPYSEERFLTTIDENKYAMKRSKDPTYHPYIEFNSGISDLTSAYKSLHIHFSHVLNIPKLLTCLSNFFLSQHQLVHQKVDFSKLSIQKDHVCYEQIRAKKIILCIGSHIAKTPWFSKLKLRLAKGETLTLKHLDFPKKIYNFGKWIVPFESEWRVGATYEWNRLNHKPTVDAKTQLLDVVKRLQCRDFEIVNHQAAIRCITSNNLPAVGQHPDINALYIFGGLGSKGAMIAPKYARLLARMITSNHPLPELIKTDTAYDLKTLV